MLTLQHRQQTLRVSGKKTIVARKKFFWGARYLWGKQDGANGRGDADASKSTARAAACCEGIRTDVLPMPHWISSMIEERLANVGAIPTGWVNSTALNIYSDGSVGLGSHYDAKARFCRPIVSLRLFGPARLRCCLQACCWLANTSGTVLGRCV